MRSSRTAVLIADSFGSPFEELKSEIQPLIWSRLPSVDVFYMRGLRPNKFPEFQNQLSEKMRYSKLWPIQRVMDNLLLANKSKKIPSLSISKNDLVVNVNEGLRNLGLKSLSAYKYLIESGYEVVYKSTLSSIVQPKIFQATIDSIDSQAPYYGGTVIHFGGKPFVSGANLFLNRKAIEILIQRRKFWQHGLLDDVAIGRLLNVHLKDVGMNTVNIQSLEQVYGITEDDIIGNIHFRCKSSANPRNDVEIMKKMISKLI